jgi:hypothetical protein
LQPVGYFLGVKLETITKGLFPNLKRFGKLI